LPILIPLKKIDMLEKLAQIQEKVPLLIMAGTCSKHIDGNFGDITMLRKLLREIRTVNKEHPGSPILLFDLRQRVPGLAKEEFDDSILELAESEGYQLVRHLYPEFLSKQDLELMVSDCEGIFYCAIIIRPRKDQLSTRRGWPQIPVHMQRVQIKSACLLPQWLAD
jgi:hypothetical protein